MALSVSFSVNYKASECRQFTNVTNRHTDRQTDRSRATARPRLYAQRRAVKTNGQIVILFDAVVGALL